MNVLDKIQNYIKEKYPYLSANIPRQIETWGEAWINSFSSDIMSRFPSEEDLYKAVDGYAEFAMDSLILTAKFQKTKEYDNKTYEEAANEVYQCEEYMHNLYLPGIFLSHYLWEHHYKQQIFYEEVVKPKLPHKGFFYDVGVGTGFYSRNLLKDTELRGIGCDMSPYSLSYTKNTLEKNNVSERYAFLLGNFYNLQSQLKKADFILSIEVLEHLEDPQTMLNCLYASLKTGGTGMISAAINAPNADHIYLYRSEKEVEKQIIKAGFHIIDSVCDDAYLARREDEIIPQNYCAFLRK